MKYLLVCFFIAISFSLMSQKESGDQQSSKHELGINFQSRGSNFLPEIQYRYHKTEQNVLSLSLGAHRNQFSYSYSLGFWNERRMNFSKNHRLFFSRGLTGNIGYSSYDYTLFNRSDLTWNAVVASMGYKIGIGYKLNKRLSIMTTINPKVNYFFLDNKATQQNRKYRFAAPFNIGLHYRF